MGAYTIVAAGNFNGFPVPKVKHVAMKETWNTLKRFMKEENLVTENVPIFMKPSVGCNRDAVGWGGLSDVMEHQFNISRSLPGEYHEEKTLDDFGFCFEASLFYEYSSNDIIPAQ